MVANRLDRTPAGLGEVTVVDRDPTHRYGPALSLHPFGSMELDDHERDLREYLRPDVRFREATVTGVDPGARRVALADGESGDDRLVVALGYAVAVDRESLHHRTYDRLYALGDCADLPTWKTAAAARKQVGTLAENPVADVTGQPREAGYDGFAARPLLTRRGTAMIAAYDYDGALAPAVESRLGWWADVSLVPRLY